MGVLIKFLFWNINKKNLIAPILELLVENAIDICALAECERLDSQCLINELKVKGQNWKLVEILPKGHIRLFAKQEIHITPKKEEKHFSCYFIKHNDINWLLSVIHAISAIHKDENSRSDRAKDISDEIRKVEEELFEITASKSIVAGDFNLQPFSKGISGIHGFNAVMSPTKASKIYRVVDSKKHYFYYNPTWKVMGDNKVIQGTYYTDNDQEDKSMYWYSFDQVLIRPALINSFRWSEFVLVDKTSRSNFIKNHKIDKLNYSDHLPIKFELMGE